MIFCLFADVSGGLRHRSSNRMDFTTTLFFLYSVSAFHFVALLHRDKASSEPSAGCLSLKRYFQTSTRKGFQFST